MLELEFQWEQSCAGEFEVRLLCEASPALRDSICTPEALESAIK